jgi:hypothetical protein
MARESGVAGSRIFAATAGVFLLLASLSYFLFVRSGDTFQRLEKLDVVTYANSAKAFQGGVYLVEGTMDEVLLAQTGRGKLVSLAISSPLGVILIPILIPENIAEFNLEKGQMLKIKVIGVGKGLLKAEKIEKL